MDRVEYLSDISATSFQERTALYCDAVSRGRSRLFIIMGHKARFDAPEIMRMEKIAAAKKFNEPPPCT